MHFKGMEAIGLSVPEAAGFFGAQDFRDAGFILDDGRIVGEGILHPCQGFPDVGARANSGNMFAGLLANVLCGGVADADSVETVLPRLKAIFEKLGYMEASSSDLFDQFLKTGMGAKPVIAGYENQLLEFAVENPEDWAQLKDDIVLIYPTPTVWSSHIYIALDEEVQRLAWENHGFRTEVSGTDADENHFGVPHLAAEITQVAAMPSYAAMEKIIAALS